MNPETLRPFLGWCLLLNVIFIAWWALFILLAPEWVFQVHGRMFKGLSRESFHAIHYAGLAFYKVVVMVFCLVPYLALIFMV